jgi:serine/threonine protein kinase/Tfp pilus assembly protein PilF
MTAPSSDEPPPDSLTAETAEALAAHLVEEMIQRWRQGERLSAEEFLGRHPELRQHPEAAADLIYEELCLRQEFGPEASAEELLGRFPQWRPQLEVLFDCQRLLGPRRVAPQFPAAGEALGDFLLLAELGRGAHGRVFLASQLSLGDRPVVLKLTPAEAGEHLSLARLQHTHIVPLYSVQDYPDRGLRALCMPYFGGATLEQVLGVLHPLPPAARTGQDLLDALDQAGGELQIADCGVRIENGPPAIHHPPSAVGNSPPTRRFLARASYVEAVCWLGACLADALQYAHERGLMHLDLKPSNVLLAADGQPMLLDFHLAREPIPAEGERPYWLGGTVGYMSPEQEAALSAIEQDRPLTVPVDGRSDVYSLGVVLYEALAGWRPEPGSKPRPLCRANSGVSVGLADVIARCLAADPAERYPDPAALAVDLRRHLAHRPLAGVRNRSLAERWRKWRRRRPHGVALGGMTLAVSVAAAAVAFAIAGHFRERAAEAHMALTDGQLQLARGQGEEAVRTLERGLAAARDLPFRHDLVAELARRLHRAEQAWAARELHELTDRLRFLYGADYFAPDRLRGLEACCRAFWEKRVGIWERLNLAESPVPEALVRDDLLDLAILWADLQVRLAPPADREAARRQALAILAEAEALFGPSAVLDAERRLHGAPARVPETRPLAARRAETAWEHYALARSLVRAGELERAADAAEQAVRLRPQGLWPNFYQGLCAYRRGRYADALTAYSVCIGAAPEAAGVFYNRALAFAALGRTEPALHDYDQAIRLEPTLAVAFLNRGMLHHHAQRLEDALADLRRAHELGADPAVVALDLALVHLARGEQAAARDYLRQALRHNPHLPEARKLHDCLLGSGCGPVLPPSPPAPTKR